MLLFTACEKDVDIFTPREVVADNENYRINAFFDAVRPDQPTYAINAQTGGIIETPLKTTLTISPNTFDLPANLSDQDQLEIKLVEVFSKGEMIARNISSTSDGILVNVAGIFKISAFFNGQVLKQRENEFIDVRFPAEEATNPMIDLFYGEKDFHQGVAWQEAGLSPNGDSWIHVQEYYDSLSGYFAPHYYINTNRLGWFSFGSKVLNDDDRLTKVDLQLPEGFDKRNTAAYVVFQNINGIMAMDWEEEKALFSAPMVPVNKEVEIVVIAIDEFDTYQFVQHSVTVSGEMTVELLPEASSLEVIREYLNGL